MSESLLAFLERIGADADTVEQATRYYLAARTNDLPHEEMRAQLLASASDRRQMEELLQLLIVRSDYLEQGALAVLSTGWEEPGQPELIRQPGRTKPNGRLAPGPPSARHTGEYRRL